MQLQRPRVGVVPDVDLVRNRGVDFARYHLYAETCQRLYEAEALPLVLPYPPDADADATQAVLAAVDGLVLIGGDFDIDPSYYGEKALPGLGTLKPDRTRFELELCKRALGDGVPLLGICGGMQLINVACGGTLYQHLPDQKPSEIVHVQAHNRKVMAHPVAITAGSLLERVCGAGELGVNTTHHQAVKGVADALQASAHAPDALVEAVEHPDHPFCLGVQWHPETLDQVDEAHRHRAVFAALVDAARERAQQNGAPRGDRS